MGVLSARKGDDREARSLSIGANAKSNTNSSAGIISVIHDVVLCADSVSSLSSRLGTDSFSALESNGRDECAALLLDDGYTQDCPLLTHRTHEGICLLHFRFELEQALQAFDPVDFGIVG